MTLSDLQPSVAVSWTTVLSPEQLWPVTCDPLVHAQFSSELQVVRLLDDPPMRLGARLEGDQLRGDRRWTTISTVTTFEHERAFGWTVPSLEDGVSPVSTWTITLTPDASGTRMGHSVVLHGGPSPMTTHVSEHPELLFDVVGERLALLARNMLRSLRGLEVLASTA